MMIASTKESEPMPTETCEATDHFDDMYPEFAPDPIIVNCHEPGRWQVVWDDVIRDEQGYPMGTQRSHTTELLCDKHHARLLEDLEDEGFVFTDPNWDEDAKLVEIIQPVSWVAPFSWRAA
jgi:hypothetical protein